MTSSLIGEGLGDGVGEGDGVSMIGVGVISWVGDAPGGAGVGEAGLGDGKNEKTICLAGGVIFARGDGNGVGEGTKACSLGVGDGGEIMG